MDILATLTAVEYFLPGLLVPAPALHGLFFTKVHP